MLGQLLFINIDFDFTSVPTRQRYCEKLLLLNIDSVQKKDEN